jgi:glycyl-tRNA synthetase beta chain
MDRELLIEVGCEEIPAGWLLDLTVQFGKHLDRRLKEARLTTGGPAEAFSTPRRLAARVAKLAERQTDLEELISGPPVSVAFTPGGEPTPAAVGFARKHGVEVPALERERTAKGEYLAFRVRQRGKATVDVLAEVMGGLLRDLTFPKHMRWDAYLEDGKGELTFARPIRWIVLLYGGRVVPFVIRRTEVAEGPTVQDVRSAANTYGHRFLTTSGRAGRAIKVKTFEDYEARLLENFVILNRSERESKIRRELESHARRLGGRVSTLAGQSTLLREVPDLVEYPSVVAGHFPVEFLQLPQEVLTTTMVQHQHYVPVVDEEGRLKPAFLAVTNMEVERPEIIARNSERVLTARLRDARFFWDEDRKTTLESRLDRLSTILFHKKIGTYREKADRVSALAEWIAGDAFRRPEAAAHAARAGLLCKADLATDMVRELTELQGTMGGIYAREEGQPEAIWKAIYYHYLPVAVAADAPPSPQQLGPAAVSWAAVSLADKLDSIVGMFWADERPTGSRDPLGLRRLGNGALRLLADLPALTGLQVVPPLRTLLERAGKAFPQPEDAQRALETGLALMEFFGERYQYILEERGFDVRNVRAVVQRKAFDLNPAHALKLLGEMQSFTDSPEFRQLAVAFKRVKNLARELSVEEFDRLERQGPDLLGSLEHPSEKTLLEQINQRRPIIQGAVAMGESYKRALTEASGFKPHVDRFFEDVRVKTDNPVLTQARLRLLRRLEGLILELADISEIVPEGQS